ncbi:hypothetical protein [Deinococcus hopiensis]|uniref:Phage major capsid protein, HK97 family n=1 Tax=Deinococcus hopiensis KR-140 TaxID=695939 RepID=A0A1W1UXT3_9DEIO|nr:hypothetical protein [Deinococcus hopiensis]SMB85800.1 hypothetical protein SAMN00790413_03548 [Deinococcus hopiensis KR-140]
MTKLALKDISLDLKQDARANKRTFAQHLQVLAEKGDLSEKLYIPEARDAQGNTVPAWKQIIARGAGIQPKGRHAATSVNDAFFTNDADRILFPLYIEERYREINNTRRNGLRLADLVADTVTAEGGATDIGIIRESDDDENADLSRIAEGAEFPVLRIESTGKTVVLYKFGGRLEATYEAILYASLSTFDRWLGNVARRSENNKIRTALRIIRNGDGNNNAAPNVDTLNVGTFELADIIALLQKAGDVGAEPTIVTGDPTEFAAMFSLDFISSPSSSARAAEDVRNTGTLPVLLGMEPRMAPIKSVLDGSRQLLAIDPSRGLTMAVDPRFDLVEYDTIIKRQIKVVQVSEKMGFAKTDIGVGTTLTRRSA